MIATMASSWKPGVDGLGNFIRTQRRLANLTLREMAELAKVSNPYLSQVERGLHEPSVRVLRSIAAALNVSAETLLAQAGLVDDAADLAGGAPAGARRTVRPTETAIRLDPDLSEAQKEALLSVYRSFVNVAPEAPQAPEL
jgi:transcriptional regulator with XRE-family HTH domain